MRVRGRCSSNRLGDVGRVGMEKRKGAKGRRLAFKKGLVLSTRGFVA